MYCGMSKGTCQTEAMLNSEKIKPVVLAVIELCLSEGISRASDQSENSFFKFCSNVFGNISSHIEGTFGLD